MALSPADRVALGLDEPPHGTQVDEFGPAGSLSPGGMLYSPTGGAEPYKPNVRLMLKEGERVSGPRIRGLVNELLAGNVAAADRALQQLLVANPKAGLELYVSLAEFSLPKLKGVAVAIDDRSENPKSLTFAQLQGMLAEN